MLNENIVNNIDLEKSDFHLYTISHYIEKP